MAKRTTGKITSGTKGWIVKLYKAGNDIDEIRNKVKANFYKITKSTIRVVIRHHLVNLADELWSAAVKVRFGWKCAVSNKTENLESHHLIRRGNWTHRWTVENGVCLNSGWHTLGSDIAAHGATDVTERFRDWMLQNYSEQWAWFEQHRNDVSRKPDIDELLEIVHRLEGATKNGFKVETRDLGERGPAESD
ncbi:hypothetical protein LCGC14_1365750 [marine sediment metagenome]|uniref:Uncharacterized protein n=1 Tax=marine sediment metagenome TaxID=412755 RepID=A0A0F9MM15_9ZZZZ